MEVVEAVEVIEAIKVLRPGKSLLRTSESSMSLDSALFGCFEIKKLWMESQNIQLNFSPFSVGGCWGQPILLFWKLVDETQMVKPLEPTIHHNSKKYLILLPLRAIYFRSLHYETPCISHIHDRIDWLEIWNLLPPKILWLLFLLIFF